MIIMDEAHYIKNKKVRGLSTLSCPCQGQNRCLRTGARTCHIRECFDISR